MLKDCRYEIQMDHSQRYFGSKTTGSGTNWLELVLFEIVRTGIQEQTGYSWACFYVLHVKNVKK